MINFTSKFVPPPGGEYFYEYEGDSFRTRSYYDAVHKTEEIMNKHKISGYPPAILAEYMCPSMPDGFCTKSYGNKVYYIDKMKELAEPYFKLPVLPYDDIASRVDKCLLCKYHARTFCPSCVGLLSWFKQMFRGKRRLLSQDSYAGVCTKCNTFVSVIASIDYKACKEESDKLLKKWEEIPETCWRNK